LAPLRNIPRRFFSRRKWKKLARFPEGYAQIKAEIERVRFLLNRNLNISLHRTLLLVAEQYEDTAERFKNSG
jgi:hypothetical protein